LERAWGIGNNDLRRDLVLKLVDLSVAGRMSRITSRMMFVLIRVPMRSPHEEVQSRMAGLFVT
jgi:hypothetical protein